MDGPTGLWVHFRDSSSTTTSVTITIRTGSFEGPIVFTSTQSGVYDVNWTYPFGPQNITYWIKISITNPNIDDSYANSIEYAMIPYMPSGVSSAYIDTVLHSVFGDSPFYNPVTGISITWTNTIMLFVMMGIFASLVRFTPTFACLAAGGAGLFFHSFIGGLPQAFLLVSILALIMGLFLILGRRRMN
jgi:hypothetical protein